MPLPTRSGDYLNSSHVMKRSATAILQVLVIVAWCSHARAQTECGQNAEPAGNGHPSLTCIELFATPGLSGEGTVRMEPVPGPFGVSVTADGRHRYALVAEIRDLPDPATIGDYDSYVAWAADPAFGDIRKLGVVTNGETRLGAVALNKFLVIVSAESTSTVKQRSGRLVLRGQSPSNLIKPHDLLSLSPLAALSSDEPSPDGHHDHSNGDWSMPPMHPHIPMAPGMNDIRPNVDAFLPSAPDPAAVPMAEPRRLVRLADGDTLHLVSGLVRRSIRGRTVLMYGFNQQYPGPLIYVNQGIQIIVNFKNELSLSTAVHWHGIRLDNRFDGVPGVTQDPVPPGGTFQYRIHFPDAGIYWYHPHHREDIQQDLGLYGNMMVRASAPDYYNPANREEVLMLDDLLLDDDGMLIPYGRQSANFALMGRFGNHFLINGEPDYRLSVRQGEVVRFFLTNASNTRTFNLRLDGARVKAVGSDVGRFEREEWIASTVLAPAERYIIDAQFSKPGTYALTNDVQTFNHRSGTFFPETDTLGIVHVSEEPIEQDYSGTFDTLREFKDVQSDIDNYRPYFDKPIDHELVMTLEVNDLPLVVEQMMGYDRVYFNPVEWSDTMPMMNWASTGREVRWVLRDPQTARENMAIDWDFRTGDVAKIRVRNERSAFHAMQHPLHVHGQRFLVLSQNGVENTNLVWKDTVLLPVGSETELLLDLANPGRWMVHCHIAEHLESGMKMVINVEE